jgi:hypothetical protein
MTRTSYFIFFLSSFFSFLLKEMVIGSFYQFSFLYKSKIIMKNLFIYKSKINLNA